MTATDYRRLTDLELIDVIGDLGEPRHYEPETKPESEAAWEQMHREATRRGLVRHAPDLVWGWTPKAKRIMEDHWG